MIPAICFGVGTGLGLWALLAWAIPPPPALGPRLARASNPSPEPILTTADTGWTAVVARPLVSGLRVLGLPGASIKRDLVVLGLNADIHLAAKAILALAGLLTPVALQGLIALGGLTLGLEVPLVAAVALAAVGFFLPDMKVRSRVARHRSQFRTALSAFLDLVWITLAGGAGMEAALVDAADIGQGPTFAHLRRALATAQLTRTPLWEALRQLGNELDITELSELAASVSLAGTEGARVRGSLAAKAQTLRTRQLTAAEAEAHSATERMAMPVAMLFLAFLGFIAYPAVTAILAGL